MIIWLVYLIPIVTVLFLIFAYRSEVTWWEYLVILVVPVGIILGIGAASKASQVRAHEFYGGVVTNATYTEPWNEWIVSTCTRCVSTDKNGNCTSTETYDCSYCSEHGDSYDYNATIDGSVFDVAEVWNMAAARWGRKFVPLGRSSDCPFPRNGNAWKAVWKGDSAHLLPYFSIHTYENRIQAAPTLFSFPKVDPKKTKVFDYPKEYGVENLSVLADRSVPHQSQAQDLLNYYNGKYGEAKEVHAYLLLFHDPDPQRGRDQEAYWIGGGKNELVTTVGLDRNNQVQWIYVFSWSPNKTAEVALRDSLMQMHDFDAVHAVELIGQVGVQHFVRKHFREFKYIQIQPSQTAIMVAAFSVLVFCLGFGFWAVRNDYDNIVSSTSGRLRDRYPYRDRGF